MHTFARVTLVLAGTLLRVPVASAAEGEGSVRGVLAGLENLQPAQYALAAKSDSKRWAWREPSPAVSVQFLVGSALPSRDVSVVLESSEASSPPVAPLLVRITGGRMIPSTLVLAPGTRVQFKNVDPFPHRLKGSDVAQLPLADLTEGATRDWTAGASGSLDVLDDSSPGLRGYIVIAPRVVRYALPKIDGHFQLTAPPGDYTARVYFAGKPVASSDVFHLGMQQMLDLKTPLKVAAAAAGGSL